MKKINKNDLDPQVFKLYDDYAHNRIDRRTFIDKLSIYAVGGLTLPSLLDFIMPDYTRKIKIKEEDPRLISEIVTYDSPKGGGLINAQLSFPNNSEGSLGGVIVVHENRGLNPHIADVGRRAALENFISIAPDALSPLGGYPGNDDDGRAMQRERDKKEMLEDFIAAFEYLSNHPKCNGRIGVVGFCFGGWVSNMMAVRLPELRAAVPFYGKQADPEEVSTIKAPILLHFAEKDERVNQGWPEYEEQLKANDVEYTAHFYPNTDHGFHNDTTPRFDEDAAVLAWERTISFFKEKLNN